MSMTELRNLPSVERVLNSIALESAVQSIGRDGVVELTREALTAARRQVMSGEPAPTAEDVAHQVLQLVSELAAPSPRP